MIDPMTAFAAVSAASSAISSAIQAGKDLSSLSGPIKKYAQAEADLQFGASAKKTGWMSKFSMVEQNAIDEHFRKEELRQLRDQMREMFMLYGAPGQWERLQAEIANQRAMRQRFLEHKKKQRDMIITIITITIAIPVIAGIVFGGVYLLKTYG